MVLPKYAAITPQISALALGTFLFVAPPAFAQGYAPVPGAPTPTGGGSSPYQPMPATSGGALGGYGKLPLNPGSAASRLEELRNLMSTTRPKEFQDAIAEYCDWLSDMADAHWKLAQAFGKQDSTKGYAESERQLCLKFGQLKRQAMLIKAEFLIAQRRYPEALGPLVDIVTAEPKTETGQNAYRLLQEIGFSDASAVASPSSLAPSDDQSATSKASAPSKPTQIPLAKSATAPH